ncbi:MlaD family protein [Nocardia otitidiscaviarum]|uniref:MlaD family protein n=1 Tax=Nocardia otitidiscaviarum TaxID=1823 RepID=UPI0024564BD2|nr:MlaD family protein [Nocardia otitidiscaviarum]
MPRVMKPSARRRDDSADELRWGIAGAVGVAILLVVCGVFYALPLGKSTYTALLEEAGSVRVGDEVRVAGIPVGAVTDLELLPDAVRMRFTVADDIVVGDATGLEIRMLTAVGGHYVAMIPAGSKPLGKQVIPADRVRLPYNLMRTFQDAATPLARIDGDVLRDNLTALQRSLSENPDSVRRVTAALTTTVDILDRQRDDIAATLTVATEYLTTIDGATSTIGVFLRRIGAVETILIDKRDEINAAVPLTVRFLSRIAALEPAYRATLQPLVHEFAAALPELQRLGQRLDEMIGTIGDLSSRLADLAPEGVVVDQSAVVLAPICVPLPGKGC